MRAILWSVSVAVVGITGAVVLHAAQPKGNGHVPPFGLHGLHGQQDFCPLAQAVHQHMREVHAELGLTDAQVESIHEAFRARHSNLAGAIRPVLEAKRALIERAHADVKDEATIRASADALGRAVGDAAMVLIRVNGEVLEAAALTADQQRKLGEMRARVDASIEDMLNMLEGAKVNTHENPH